MKISVLPEPALRRYLPLFSSKQAALSAVLVDVVPTDITLPPLKIV